MDMPFVLQQFAAVVSLHNFQNIFLLAGRCVEIEVLAEKINILENYFFLRKFVGLFYKTVDDTI